ncbi:MAG: hypothetical protein BMS9Abin36_2246 [Gammaproteobacteria bacterium]|nr:MAG: hypothetical protein BMS9Abin36_2246 [Gammaproteobacteria bacterium]
MKFQRGDAGVGMLVIMVVMIIGVWVASGHGGSGHHAEESVTNSSSSAQLDLPAEQVLIP